MYIAQLEFKRIQTFLFSSSRMRDMVAANALFGHTIRVELVNLAINYGASQPPEIDVSDTDNDADVAVECMTSQMLMAKGILGRDGGHFFAHFVDDEDKELNTDDKKEKLTAQEKAKQFITAAVKVISQKLPGITVQHRAFDSSTTKQALQKLPFKHAVHTQLPELPIFEKCQQSNSGVAEQLSNRKKEELISASTALKNEHYNRVFNDKSLPPGDFASEIMQALTQDQKNYWTDFDTLVGSDYLAVISADGNNMGQRFKQYLDQNKQNYSSFVAEQILAESFFESARNTLKEATKTALVNTFKNKSGNLPYQLLMLGGDDLLIVCQAKYAFKLIIELNQQLESSELIDNAPLTLAFGVAIASHNLPFYRLHQAAEKLNASAKILSRSCADKNSPIQPSTIDWHIVTQAWLDNPIDARKQQKIRHYEINNEEHTLILSEKPYLLNATEGTAGFQAINTLAEKLVRNKQPGQPQEDEEIISRSALFKLQHTLTEGVAQTELFLSTLTENFKKELKKNGIAKSGFSETTNNTFTTKLSDVIELIELQYLSRDKEEAK
ncbi:Cas10/Cmr2 second palm domain-containing protein [Pseudoalteromonas sp. T1lg65]|uniref:Cas10/Cmr2 second palm domain-containing protein n=1 Tax=Pseudoalteromonas sp. T1lg65 TaxID=2077101 RepID=UPI003F7A3C8B